MCVSLNTSVRTKDDYKTNTIVNKNLTNEPLNLNLPEDFGKELAPQDQVNLSSISQKKINVPNVPIYNDGATLRATEFGPNSAKFEFGKEGERPLLTLKATNEELRLPNGRIETTSKASIDSPYLRRKAADYAKETLMDNVVDPLRNNLGRTTADTALVTTALVTAVVAAKHLPDGNFKVDLPTKNITGDDSLRARVVIGYGDGKSLKPAGVELSKKFQYDSQNVEIKARYRTDAEVNGIRGVNRAEIDVLVTDQKIKETSGALSFRIGHDKEQGTSAGLFYSKKF